MKEFFDEGVAAGDECGVEVDLGGKAPLAVVGPEQVGRLCVEPVVSEAMTEAEGGFHRSPAEEILPARMAHL